MKIKRLPPERATLEICEQKIVCMKCDAAMGQPCRYFSGEKAGRIAARPHPLRIQMYAQLQKQLQEAKRWTWKESNSAILSYRASQMDDYERMQDWLRTNIGLFLALASEQR